MKAAIELDVTPFAVPSNACLMMAAGAVPMPASWNQPGIPPVQPYGGLTVPLSKLEPATLGQMCDQFRRDVFKAAGFALSVGDQSGWRERAEAAEARLDLVRQLYRDLQRDEVYNPTLADRITELLNGGD